MQGKQISIILQEIGSNAIIFGSIRDSGASKDHGKKVKQSHVSYGFDVTKLDRLSSDVAGGSRLKT